MVFDRSWYNRAGVERVLGFCTDDQYKLFLERRAARINCISHLLTVIPYEHMKMPRPDMPLRQDAGDYVRPPRNLYRNVPT